MIVSDFVMVESEPYSKIGWTDRLKICNMVDGLCPHFLLTISLGPGVAAPEHCVSSKCFWNVSLELKVIPRNFT